MALTTIKLYSKLDNTIKPLVVTGKKYTPKIMAKNWYQINTNYTLKWIITFHGALDFVENFDSVEVAGKRFSILSSDESSANIVRLEVGI